MRPTRRELCVLAGCSFAAAGCLDVIRGEEPARVTADPAPVGEEPLAETDYEHQRTEETEETRTFEAASSSREVEVVNVRTEYDKSIDAGPLGETRAAVFATFATPKVEVLGRTFNPIEDMDNHEIAVEVQSRYEEVSIGEEIDRRTLTIVDDETAVSKFDGQATIAGTGIDVFVHVGRAEAGDEYVVVFAIYPQLLSGEEAEIVTLAEGVTVEDG